MKEKRFVQIGSNVEKAVQGDYSLDVPAILKEGWALTQKNKQSILSGLSFILLIGVIITLVASEYMGGIEQVMQDNQKQMLLNFLITVLLWPFIAGIEMMGISHAVGIKTRTGFVFAFLKRSAFIAMAALIITLISTLIIGSIVSFLGLLKIDPSLINFVTVIVGLILTIFLSASIPLIVEKNMTPILSIILSVKAIRFQWLKLLQIYSVFILLAILTLLPGLIGIPPILSFFIFLVALFFLAPFYYNVKGILYREIFGVQMQVIDNNGDQDMFFSA
ncbi:hypothetical protein A9Q98_10985 [Thalassotalea sp. 42_200_T64]|nr:hypothetical protein A9Q98_10985 [Thalassotalea sp. 42_200_T64]